THTLSVQRRPTGRSAVRALRRQGLVPGILYGSNIEPIPIAAQFLALRPFVVAREARIIRLLVEGEAQPYDCLLKATTFDPVTDALIHFDLQVITADRPVEVEIPVVLVGTPVGVAQGGILEHFVHTVRAECLPKDLPEHITVDISHLGIGQSIHVRELSLPNIRILEHGDSVLATVVAPTAREGRVEGG
ncbi:MAG: 50S ribosomal protein L25, partial [Candidatus Kapabacteria bacterium]|nr:50S ribosomal protein L25 [Candidatus Kapabacteria bacterium]MDW8225618.1 50S ribosomal protein L25 [Bacteroidota bacterium]